jgi:hypothetical protein
MSETNGDFLLRRVGELERQLAESNAEAKKRRLSSRKLQAECDALKAERETLAAERDTLKTTVETAPSEWRAKYEDLSQQVRTRDHRDAWARVLGDQLAAKVPVEEVWSKLGYRPGDELPTEQQIKEQAGTVRETAPYLFQTASATDAPDPRGSQRAAGGTLEVGLDAGRGAPDKGTEKLYVRESQLKDPRFALPNTKALAEASRAGNLVVLPG